MKVTDLTVSVFIVMLIQKAENSYGGLLASICSCEARELRRNRDSLGEERFGMEPFLAFNHEYV